MVLAVAGLDVDLAQVTQNGKILRPEDILCTMLDDGAVVGFFQDISVTAADL